MTSILSLRAITRAVSDLATGRGLGLALVCPEARYASIAWRRAERLDRRHSTPLPWKEIELDLQLGLPPGPLDAISTVVGGCLMRIGGARWPQV